MSKPLCLVVDDEPDILELLVMTLKRMGIKSQTAQNLSQAKALLQSNLFDLCLTDMRLPDGNGIDLVAFITHYYPQTPVAMITAHGNIKSAIQAMKTGAFDFLTKPINIQELRNLVHMALQLTFEQTKQRDELLSRLIGQSEAMRTVRSKIIKLARSQAPIYIKGESGTGKEVVARMIHALGPRTSKPFIPINCGAIPAELMESEFFGYKKGSFSGALHDKFGLFQAAQKGTLFLDEVADLPLSMQVKLLRAIQEKQIRPIGMAQEIPVDVRILSATHRDLSELVKKGKFRQDLFYRINVIEVHIPPLRERTEDIPDLVHKILTDLSLNISYQQPIPHLTENASKTLNEYSFPGNVRELENILERAMTLCENNVIKTEDLQLPKDEKNFIFNEFTNSHLEPLNEFTNAHLEPLLEDIEKETILNALEQTNWNKTKAAQLLGISFGALRYRLQKLKVGKREL